MKMTHGAPDNRHASADDQPAASAVQYITVTRLVALARNSGEEGTTARSASLDGLVMGGYDLLDIVLPEAVRWGIAVAAVAAVTAIAYRVLKRRAPITRYARDPWWGDYPGHVTVMDQGASRVPADSVKSTVGLVSSCAAVEPPRVVRRLWGALGAKL